MLLGKYINRYYLKHLPVLLIGVAALIMVDYVQLVIPNLYQMIINGMNDGTVVKDGVSYVFDMDFLIRNIFGPFLAVIFLMAMGRITWRFCFFGSAVKVETDLRSRMFDRSKELSHQFYQVNKVGNMMALFTNDLDTVRDCFGNGIMMFFDATFLGVMAMVKMARMNLILACLTLIPLVLLCLSGLIVGKYMTAKWKKRQEITSKISELAQESFSGIAVIKAFIKEAVELSRFKRLNKNNEDVNVEYVKLSVGFNITVTLLVESVTCIILGYGGYLAYKGVFNAGQLVEYIGYFNATVWPVMAVSQLIEMNSKGKASLGRIGDLLDTKSDVSDRDGVSDIDDIKGDIEFRNLTFRYPGGEMDVLKNVSLKINAGENVGIVGRTGAGKTTLVDLILRTYNVPDGTVFIDGHDVNDIPIKTVRKYAAYVPQDNFLFSDTIANNISFASDTDDFRQIKNAAVFADIDENISEFTEKYDTVLGERGVTVSGGQKQRISIARALMKNAPILILDDSVSAVDVKTEKTILENLKNLRSGKTTVLIAHRISTIEKMDKIIFIDDGEILAVGNHDGLYDTCREYHDMVELQRLDDEETAKGERSGTQNE